MTMTTVFYYQDGTPQVLQLDENRNLVYQGAPTEGTLANFTSKDITLDVLDPSVELDAKGQELRDALNRDFRNLVARSDKAELTPLAAFNVIYAYLKAHQAAQFMAGMSRGVRVSTSEKHGTRLMLGAPVRPPSRADGKPDRGVVAGAPELPPADRAVIDRFLRADSPCFFPSCEALRGELAEAIDAKGGAKCPSCTRSQIEMQFSERALSTWKIETKKDENPTTTPADNAGDHVVPDDVVQG